MSNVRNPARHAEADVEALVGFIEARSPGYAARICATDPETIAELDRAMDGRAPPHYRAFLAAMGYHTAELDLLGADCMATLALQAHELGQGRFHKRFYFVGRGDQGEFPPSLYLDAGRPCGTDCAVAIVRTGPTPPQGQPAAYRSWLGFLSVCAFHQFAVGRRAHEALVAVTCDAGETADQRVRRIVAMLTALGFVRVLGDHPGFACAERGDASVVIHEQLEVPGGLAVWLAADDGRELLRLQEIGRDNGAL